MYYKPCHCLTGSTFLSTFNFIEISLRSDDLLAELPLEFTGIGKLARLGTGIGKSICRSAVVLVFLLVRDEEDEDDAAFDEFFNNSAFSRSIFSLSALIFSVSDRKSKNYRVQKVKRNN